MLALEEGLMQFGVSALECLASIRINLQSTGLTNQTRLLHGPPNFHSGNKRYQEALKKRLCICGLSTLELLIVSLESALR